jgi:universal stress protein A
MVESPASLSATLEPKCPMIRMQTVMVATDFSEPSEAAVEYAKAVAETFHAALHVIHVLDVTGGDSSFLTATTLATMRGEAELVAREKLEEILSANERKRLSATLDIVPGSPFPSIIAYAEEHKVDLIVLGTNGRGRLAQLFVGSVAERVVRDAPCPVLTVHAGHEVKVAK